MINIQNSNSVNDTEKDGIYASGYIGEYFLDVLTLR